MRDFMVTYLHALFSTYSLLMNATGMIFDHDPALEQDHGPI